MSFPYHYFGIAHVSTKVLPARQVIEVCMAPSRYESHMTAATLPIELNIQYRKSTYRLHRIPSS